MKIVILAPYANPEKGAAIVRVNSFSDYFASKGNGVAIFAPMRGNLMPAGNIARYRGITGMLGLLWKSDFDALIAVSPPIAPPFFALPMCRLKGKKFVLDSKDIFTMTARMPSGAWEKIKFWIYSVMEMLAHKNADKILVLDSTIGRWLGEKYRIPEGKIVVAQNGVDTKIVRANPAEGKKIRKRMGISPDSAVFIYLGGLGDESYLEFLRECAGLIKESSATILFVIASDDTAIARGRIAAIRNAVKGLGLEGNFRMAKNIPHNEVYRYLSAADIGVDFWEGFRLFAVPVKILEYMACGLPIAVKIPKNNESFEKFFSEYDAGFGSDNWRDFSAKLGAALENFGEFRAKGIKNAGAIRAGYTREASNETVLRVLKGLR